MKKVMLITIASAMMLAPATGAMAAAHPDHPDHAKGPKTEKTSKAKAYGKFCQGQSKTHVKGTKGTDFSRCVNAMAKADHNEKITAREACKELSKKHVKGTKGTPYSRCIVGVAQMRKNDN